MNETDIFTFDAFPILTTERMVLRELQTSDAADVFVFRSDPKVQKYNAEPMQHVQEARVFIERMRAEYAARKRLIWAAALPDDNRVIGLVGLGSWSRHHHRAEVGYDFAHAYWGQGLGSEAVKAVLRFGFEHLQLHRIYASTIADNVESVNMLEKLGFQREGTQREYSLEDDGLFHDSAMYGLLKHEFMA
jgi:ribosomal-protein-alanine N-acetyltransferase